MEVGLETPIIRLRLADALLKQSSRGYDAWIPRELQLILEAPWALWEVIPVGFPIPFLKNRMHEIYIPHRFPDRSCGDSISIPRTTCARRYSGNCSEGAVLIINTVLIPLARLWVEGVRVPSRAN